MPLYFTPYQETEFLKKQGLSSDDYQIEPETGAIRRRQKIQPSFDLKTSTPEQLGIEGSLEKPKDDKPSIAGAFGRGVASELIPSSGAILTGSRAASALMPWAVEAAPATRGLSLAVPPIAGVGTGLLTAFGLGKAQESILPESVKATLQQDIQQQPIASLTGRIAANFPLLRPSLSNLKTAAGTTGHIAENLLTGGVKGPVDPADISNLINVGLGGATGVGASVVPRILANQPVDPLEAILSGAGGALFSEPTKIGRKLGLHPTEPKVDKLKRLQAEQRKPGETLEERATEGLRPKEEDVEAFDISTADTRPTKFFSEKGKDNESYIIPFKRIPKQHKELFPAFFDEKGKLKNVDEPTFREMLDKRLYPEEFQAFKDNLAEAEAIKRESDLRQQIDEAQLKNQQDIRTLQNQLEASIKAREKPPTFKVPKPEEVKPGTRALSIPEMGQKQVTTLKQRAYNKEANYQQWKKLWKKASIEGDQRARKEAENFLEKGFAERYTLEEIEGKPQPKFSEIENLPARIEPKGGTKFQEAEQGPQRLSSAEKLEQKVNPEDVLPKASLFDYVKKTFGPLRNIDIQEGVVVDRRTNKEAKGVAITQEGINTRIARINPFKATLDTLGHEPFHIFGEDLRNSPNKIDRDTMAKFDKAIENSLEFKRINEDRIKRGLEPHTVEEIGTEEFGIEFAKRILNPDKMEGTLKRAWQDFLGRVRVKWGNASTEDFTRLLTNRFFKDPDYFTQFGKSPISAKPTEKLQENKENEPKSKQTDELKDNAEKNIESDNIRNTIGEQKQMEEGRSEINRREQGYKLSEESQGLNPEQNEILFLRRKLKSLRDDLKAAGVEDIYGDHVDYSGAKSKYLPAPFKLNEFLNDENIPSNTKLLVQKFLAVQDDLKDLGHPERYNPMEGGAPKDKFDYEGEYQRRAETTEEISGRLGEASVKAASNTIRQQGAERQAAKDIDNVYTDLATFVENRFKEVNPKIKNLDLEFLKDEITSIKNNDNVEAAYRKKLGDEFIDELKSRIDNELVPALKTYEEEVRTTFEVGGKSNKKAEELEAFERTDVERHSEEEQGLKNKKEYTPEKILERIQNTRTSTEFKKQGVFTRGIKELAAGRLPIVGSDIDKLELRGDKAGKLIAPALREYFAVNRELEGRYLNPSLEAINKLKAEDLDDLYSKMLSEKKTQVSQRENLNEKQLEAYDVLRATIKQKQEDQIKAGQKVQGINRSGKIFYRLPKIDPYYVPEIVGSKQLDILLNETGSPAYNNLKKDFIKYQRSQIKNLSESEALRMFDELLASYGGPVKGDTTHFGAVRRSEGIGLPESWLESDMATAMRRYWRRVAKDRAFYDTVETDHNLLHIIGRRHDNEGKPIKFDENLNSLSGNETLGNIMDIIQGRFIKTNPRLDAASRIASNAVLGPITGITDSINAAPLLAKFIPSVAHIPSFLKAGLNINDGIKDAFKQGIIRENVTSFGDIVSPSDEFTERLRNVANLVSKVNTREYLEKFSRGLSQALSSYLVDVHTGLAETGNQKSIDLLTGLANGKDYTKLSRNELASRLVELTQGTYDPRGLPSWAIDSQIAPFFRLAKWNIEQLNNLHKHVLLPAAKGNLTPLLMTLGGGLIGGYLAKEVREKLNLKKQNYPEYKEILESSRGAEGNIPALAYNLAAAISYSGITGLLGDVTKAGFDVAFKNTPQGFNYPLIEIVGDGSVKLAQAADAIAEGETPIDVVPKLLEDLFLKNVQIGRVVYNQIAGRTGAKQKFEDTESRRNLRVYKMAEGLPYQAQGIQSDYENPYKNLKSKDFKRKGLKEIQTAVKEGQELIKESAKASKGNIEEFKKKTSGLKKMPVTTLPSPENDPVGFAKFINYNNRVRGRADTRERVRDYFEQKQANRIKASFIP